MNYHHQVIFALAFKKPPKQESCGLNFSIGANCQTDPLALLSLLDRERSKDSGSASMESMTGM